MAEHISNRLSLVVIAAGVVTIAFGLKAYAEQNTAPVPAAAVPDPQSAAAPPEDESLRQSADNNISFPVDI